ncbi:MAG TPA: asparaginase [Pseudonocardiaceae bacterium]|jgi:L-asparaginase|nr:asparaginase [Pseudonocardiaceae bacterium]
MSGRRVVLYGLGGTIAMAARSGGGVSPALSPSDLLAAVPGLVDTGIAVDVVDFRQVPGASVSFADLRALAGEIASSAADGVVITQGTDTIEESAYLLDLGHAGAMPIVVTGAMRNPTLAGADGPANLLAAIQVAASPAARDQGCLVVFADEIHAARRVRKTHATSIATFVSPNGGPLGYVVEGRPTLLTVVPHRTVVPLVPVGANPARVALVTVTLDDDGSVLDALSHHVDGLVVAAFGAGHVPVAMIEPLAELARRVPVILASRTGAGSTLTSTYGFPGSERDLLGRGLIGAGLLDPFKSRLLLRSALAAGADLATVSAAFGVAGGYRDPSDWPW